MATLVPAIARTVACELDLVQLRLRQKFGITVRVDKWLDNESRASWPEFDAGVHKSSTLQAVPHSLRPSGALASVSAVETAITKEDLERMR